MASRSEAHPEDQPHEVEYRVTIQRLGNLPIGICWNGQEPPPHPPPPHGRCDEMM